MNIVKNLLFVVLILSSVQDELVQELNLIEDDSKEIKVHLPKNKANESKKLASKKTRPQIQGNDDEILDLEAEIRQEEIRLQRAAPRRVKRDKDIYQDENNELDL